MAVNDFTLARRALAGMFDGLNDANTVPAYLFRKDFDVSDGGTAGTGVAESVALQIGGGQSNANPAGLSNVNSQFWFTPQVAVTANDTNFATINFYKKTGTGTHVQIATLNTKTTASGGSGNLSALVPVRVPVVSPPISLAVADVITYEVLKGGTGVALAAATGNALVTIDLGAG